MKKLIIFIILLLSVTSMFAQNVIGYLKVNEPTDVYILPWGIKSKCEPDVNYPILQDNYLNGSAYLIQMNNKQAYVLKKSKPSIKYNEVYTYDKTKLYKCDLIDLKRLVKKRQQNYKVAWAFTCTGFALGIAGSIAYMNEDAGLGVTLCGLGGVSTTIGAGYFISCNVLQNKINKGLLLNIAPNKISINF